VQENLSVHCLIVWFSKTCDSSNKLIIEHCDDRGIGSHMALQQIAVEAVFIERCTLTHQYVQGLSIGG